MQRYGGCLGTEQDWHREICDDILGRGGDQVADSGHIWVVIDEQASVKVSFFSNLGMWQDGGIYLDGRSRQDPRINSKEFISFE